MPKAITAAVVFTIDAELTEITDGLLEVKAEVDDEDEPDEPEEPKDDSEGDDLELEEDVNVESEGDGFEVDEDEDAETEGDPLELDEDEDVESEGDGFEVDEDEDAETEGDASELEEDEDVESEGDGFEVDEDEDAETEGDASELDDDEDVESEGDDLELDEDDDAETEDDDELVLADDEMDDEEDLELKLDEDDEMTEQSIEEGGSAKGVPSQWVTPLNTSIEKSFLYTISSSSCLIKMPSPSTRTHLPYKLQYSLQLSLSSGHLASTGYTFGSYLNDENKDKELISSRSYPSSHSESIFLSFIWKHLPLASGTSQRSEYVKIAVSRWNMYIELFTNTPCTSTEPKIPAGT